MATTKAATPIIPESTPEPETPSVIDLDAIFAARIEKNAKAIEVKGYVKLFGRQWRVIEAGVIRSLRLANIEKDQGAFLSGLYGMIHPSERLDFQAAIEEIDGIDAPLLMDLYKAIAEAGIERPTKRSSNSRTTPSTRRRTTS